MSVAPTTSNPYAAVKSEPLDYNQEMQTDENLKLLSRLLPERANIEKPNLGKYCIGPVTLIILNFTSYEIRVDHLRKLFIDNLNAGTYTPDDCHLILFQLQNGCDDWQNVRRIEKDDASEKISKIVLGKFKSGYWGVVPVSWDGAPKLYAPVTESPAKKASLNSLLGGESLTGLSLALIKAVYPEDEVEAHFLKPITAASSMSEKMYRVQEVMGLISQQLHSALGKERKNVCFSPFSILPMICMAAEGLSPSVRERFFYSLGLKNLNLDELHTVLKMIAASLDSTEAQFPVKLQIASGMAVVNSLDDRFIEKMKTGYDAQIFSGMQDSELTSAALNKWVNDKTNNLFPNFISSAEIVDHLSILFNASCLEGTFSSELTTPLPFYLENGEALLVPTIRQSLKLKHCEEIENEWSMVEIPFQGGKTNDLCCLIFLPNASLKNTSLSTLENSLSLKMIQIHRESAQYCDIELELPKIEMSIKTDDLIPSLLSGWPNKFEGIKPGIIMMESGEEVFLGGVIHQATIKFDENGPKAKIDATDKTEEVLSDKPYAKPFKVNAPFAYVIIHKDTILFQGSVKEASAFPKI